jgi:hypothetical protein
MLVHGNTAYANASESYVILTLSVLLTIIVIIGGYIIRDTESDVY